MNLLWINAQHNFSFTEGLTLEQFSTVTQVVISVMNLSDMLQQDREDASISELVGTQQNRLASLLCLDCVEAAFIENMYL